MSFTQAIENDSHAYQHRTASTSRLRGNRNRHVAGPDASLNRGCTLGESRHGRLRAHIEQLHSSIQHIHDVFSI